MTDTAIGLLGIAGLFGLMILRTPVGIAMLITGFVGIYVLDGARTANAVMVTETYSSVANYSLTVVPLFVLLGNVASRAGFSRSLYEAAFAWIGPFRGGLASASVLGCAAFAAVSGSSVATAVTIGRVALPEMKRLGYGDALSTGAIAAGGTLGFLIPPSTGMIIYAILTEQSIGRLFMAGVFPGLLLTGLFLIAIYIVTTRRPEAGPPGPRADFAHKTKTLRRSGVIVGIVVVTIGGIYLGIFTPVEAAGVGAFLTFMMALYRRSLDWRKLRFVLLQTLQTTATVFMILIGAFVFIPFMALTQIPSNLVGFLVGLDVGQLGVLIIILVTYIALGTFLEGLAMLVLTLHITFPVIIEMGLDPIWFGVVVVIVLEMGLISPPVGVNVFVVKSVAGDVPMSTIFRGIWPFWIAMGVCLAFLVAFPQIALFLPNTMFG